MLKEYGRLDGSGDPKTTGIKYVAPWLANVAERRPEWILPHLSHLVGHLSQADAYPLRSAVVTAFSSILLQQHTSKAPDASEQQTENQDSENNEGSEESPTPSTQSPATNLSTNTREQILQFLVKQTHDVSSFTRSTVLKAWSRLVSNRALPKGWILRVTQLALERLSDKTVVVRKQAMQVRFVNSHKRFDSVTMLFFLTKYFGCCLYEI